MSMETGQVFIQARMSSRRFPGKVLAPFHGRPLIAHLVETVHQALPGWPIRVVTSRELSDDPLVAYLNARNIPVFRGELDRVFDRFRQALGQWPSDWVLRLNADSPLHDPAVLRAVAGCENRVLYDLITTIQPRTFPKGRNAELIRASAFAAISPEALSPEDQEHVTAYCYRHPERFRILNIESGIPEWGRESLAVDTVEDLKRLEAMPASEVKRWTWGARRPLPAA